MDRTKILKRLEAIRCWLAPDAKSVETAKAELAALIEDINQEGESDE